MTHIFKSPKYWAELRAERRKLQAASLKQAIQETVPWNDIAEASSLKRQASEASSGKPQAPHTKLQASSRKRQAP
jgi:hypothetical protein|tara:strand:- start:180 stop:404 length:225 start_codon:yes stop_codon:yes gene_type:complete